MAENITRLSGPIKASDLPCSVGRTEKLSCLSCIKTYFTDWRAGKEIYPHLCSRLASSVLLMARSSYTVCASVRNIFHGHKYRPLGPLKVKIISFLMWIPLWKKLPRMGVPSLHHLLVLARSSAAPNVEGSPTPWSPNLQVPHCGSRAMCLGNCTKEVI